MYLIWLLKFTQINLQKSAKWIYLLFLDTCFLNRTLKEQFVEQFSINILDACGKKTTQLNFSCSCETSSFMKSYLLFIFLRVEEEVSLWKQSIYFLLLSFSSTNVPTFPYWMYCPIPLNSSVFSSVSREVNFQLSLLDAAKWFLMIRLYFNKILKQSELYAHTDYTVTDCMDHFFTDYFVNLQLLTGNYCSNFWVVPEYFYV